MATYIELSTIHLDDQWNDLLSKVRVACSIKAAAIVDSATPTVEALGWAKNAIKQPGVAGNDLAFYAVAVNESATLAQIYTATDTAVQANVDAAVDASYGV